MRRLLSALLAIAAATLVAAPAAAAVDTDLEDRIVVAGGDKVRSGESVGDLIVVEGTVEIEGRVTGDVIAVEGDVLVPGGIVEGDLTTLAGRARLQGGRVEGDLFYFDEEPELSRGAVVEGEISDEGWSELADGPWALVGAFALWLTVSLALLLIGVVLLALAPDVAAATAAALRRSPWESLAFGLAAMVGLALIGAFALLTIVGIPLGAILLLSLVPLAAIGYVAASHALGALVLREREANPIAVFLVGFAILRAVALVPLVGTLAFAVAASVGVGLLLVSARAARRERAA